MPQRNYSLPSPACDADLGQPMPFSDWLAKLDRLLSKASLRPLAGSEKVVALNQYHCGLSPLDALADWID